MILHTNLPTQTAQLTKNYTHRKGKKDNLFFSCSSLSNDSKDRQYNNDHYPNINTPLNQPYYPSLYVTNPFLNQRCSSSSPPLPQHCSIV